MAERRISADQSPGAPRKSGDLLWRRRAYPLGSPCRSHLEQEGGDSDRPKHREALPHEHDLGYHLEGTSAVHDQGTRRRQCGCVYRISQTVSDRRQAEDLPDRRSGPGAHGKENERLHQESKWALRLFFLPPYSPDKNKADTVGRTAIFGGKDFTSKVRSSLRSLQRNPKKVRSFFQKESLKYAA